MSGGTAHEAYDVCDLAKMQMLAAAMESDTDEVMKYIRDGSVHVDACDDDRVTALQIAAATGNVQLVIALLEHEANIDFANQVGMTAFHQACREGNLKVFEVLLQRGANIHAMTYLGCSALALAASGGHDTIVRKLIPLSASKGCPLEGYAPTPLIAAAFRGNPVTLSILVKIGKANINEVVSNLYNLSPLTCAVLCSNRPMISCLLEHNADPSHIALKNKSALGLAEYQRRGDVVEMFREHAQKRKIPIESKDLRQLIIEGDLEKMTMLIEKRKEAVQEGVPPTVFATVAGNMNSLRHMITQMDLAVNEAENKLHLDSLMIAAMFRDSECYELLLANGALTTAMNSLGQTAYDLYFASTEECEDHVRLSLSTYSPRKQSVFRLSGGNAAFSKMLSSSRHKFGLPDRSDAHAAAVRMRDLFESRKATWAVVGRNRKKLLLAEDLIRGRREMAKRRDRNSLNRLIDVTRSMAEEVQSFSAVCFYDIYNRDVEPKNSQGLDSDKLPKGELDLAVYRSTSYVYRGRKGEQPQQQQPPLMFASQVLRSPYAGIRSSLNRSAAMGGDLLLDVPQQSRIRRAETTAGGTAIRTTPRMLKKSRESISSMESVGSARSLAFTSLTPLEESSSTLRSFRSSPHLVGVPPIPPRRPSPYYTPRVLRGADTAGPSGGDSVMLELTRRGFGHIVNILEEQEILEDQLINVFSEIDFREMGITRQADIDALKDVQRAFRR